MKNAVKVYIRDLLDATSPHGPAFTINPFQETRSTQSSFHGYSDAAVEQYVKNNSNLSLDVHHFTSHCKMAPLNAGGVVDGNTRVYGTKNVFVADNSICPVIPDINTAAPAMMIGLRSSEILKRVLRE